MKLKVFINNHIFVDIKSTAVSMVRYLHTINAMESECHWSLVNEMKVLISIGKDLMNISDQKIYA
jgi:hypothetical protein